jgi:hypothetical protein
VSPGVLALVLAATAASPAPPPIRFEEIGGAAGARFEHSTRSFGERHKAQVLQMFTDGGAAAAVGDFDGDGHDDLFLTDSDEGKPNHLLHNLYGETGELRFEDVAAAAGVAGGNDAHSIVADALWLDFDDDGRLDLLVSRFGTPLLYRNLTGSPPSPSIALPPSRGERDARSQPSPGERADGVPARFAEVSAAAGLTKFGNTIAAACSATGGTARSRTSPPPPAPTTRAGACRRCSSTTTATAGSTSCSGTTSGRWTSSTSTTPTCCRTTWTTPTTAAA